MLNFDKETISIVQNDSTGAIIASGELTIVGLPNEFFRILIFMFFLTFSGFSYSDNHETQKEEVLNKVEEIAKEIEDEDEFSKRSICRK